jgi:putative Mg2+ transporter-C (MgtC) family protein
MRTLQQYLGPRLDVAAFLSESMLRLILAVLLGGLIGLERELKRKPAGLRTNMFICFGAAMFTLLSLRLAGPESDPTRIAAQIIPGIGFIGAGAILHARGSVSGLTTAATIFVVASVGMAAGGGQYLAAIFATMIILLALHSLGWVEARFNLKPLSYTYEAVGEKAEEILGEVNRILDEERRIMQSVQVGRTNGSFRVLFSIQAMRREHDALYQRFRRSPTLQRTSRLGADETE